MMMRSNFTPGIRDLASRLTAMRARGSGSSCDDSADDSTTAAEPPSLYALMEETVSIDERPFLLSQRRLHQQTVRLDQKSIRVGQLLRENGDFAQTYEVASCARLAIGTTSTDYFGNNNDMSCSEHEPMGSQSERLDSSRRISLGDRFRRRRVSNAECSEWGGDDSFSCRNNNLASCRYTIKRLRRREEEDYTTSSSSQQDPFWASRKLLVEALYLSVLDHPGILKLQAFSNPTSTCDQIFVVTDRIEETLEDRMLLWRRLRREREEAEDKHYRKEKKRMERINNQRTRRRSCDTPKQQRKRQENVFLLETPTPFQQEVKSLYPEDLVALKTNYALQIAEALEYLHARGIVVCDLRPDTIGFKGYPHHHTVQIMDLSSAKELPMDAGTEATPSLPATEIPQSIETVPDLTDSSNSMDDSSWMGYSAWSTVYTAMPFKRNLTPPAPFRRNLTPPAPSRPRLSLSPLPATDNSSGTSASSLNSSSTWSVLDTDGNSSHTGANFQRRRKGNNITGISPSFKTRRCYRAPELYVDVNDPAASNRFNHKVDSYSLAMIFYELLADRRPFPPNAAMTDQDHLQRVRGQQLRPSLRQCYFPLTIQEILQQAWLPAISRRWDASQIVKSLTRVLPVLEGQGLHTSKKNGARITNTRRRHSTTTNTATEPLTLPQRAAKVLHSKGAKGWEQVRKTGPVRSS
ncbi:expressed unknown protein [Seminavis robusta]|uniref:Protein kinase domain-containing protein n=1 Tax=Seminavis robusta TaxID=568900 RepID=A0A9N8HNR2_9STRA|nr:expressed unknown protein [Seminavis robusta]|eukprot:Sro1008_g230620.1 n/a (692) ;mRNA; f:34926-37092